MIVTCCQLAAGGDAAQRHASCLEAIAAARAGHAEVVILPELVTSGYVFTSPEEAASLAIDPNGDLLAGWAGLLAGTDAVVIGGFCERGPGGRLYNSAALVDGRGVRAVYRKTHLWDSEKVVFTPGELPPPVVETSFGRIGLLVCYDLEFPELPRLLALGGADLLAVPTSWPLVDRPAGERPPEVIIAMGAARANRVAIACCDRFGVERGQRWTGGSTIVDADGWVTAAAGGEGLATARIDPARSRDKRISERNDVLGDRRPELYGPIISPEGTTA